MSAEGVNEALEFLDAIQIEGNPPMKDWTPALQLAVIAVQRWLNGGFPDDGQLHRLTAEHEERFQADSANALALIQS